MLNPIMVKELRIHSRRTILYWVGLIYLLMVSISACILIWQYKLIDPLNDILVTSRSVFVVFTTIAVVINSFVSPSIALLIINAEKDISYLDFLKLTRLKSYQILSGKFICLLFYTILVNSLSAPVIMLLASFSGVSIFGVARFYLITIFCNITFGFVGISYSAIFKRIKTVAILTFATTVFFLFGTLMMKPVLRQILRSRNIIAESIFRGLNPIHATINILDPRDTSKVAGLSLWLFLIISYLFLIIVFSIIANFKLNLVES
ncbi:hypothetical protein GF312_10270 [Candidatus Poribacteria bacterium]|nr:hypothetical protein [Candidatus Poribacteria bacterium]